MGRSLAAGVCTLALGVTLLSSCGGVANSPSHQNENLTSKIRAAHSADVQAANSAITPVRVSSGTRPSTPWTPTLKWSYSTPEPIYYSSPAIGKDGTIYVANGEWGQGGNGLYAFNPGGTLKWFYDNGQHIYMYTPVIAPDGTIYVQDAVSSLYAVNSDGTLKWKHAFSAQSDVGQTAPAVSSSGMIYVGADTIYAIDSTGTVQWQVPTVWGDSNQVYQLEYVRTSPTIGADGTIYAGVTGMFYGNVYGSAVMLALNPDGTRKWAHVLPGSNAIFSSPAIGPDGTIYFGSETSSDINTFYALNPDGTLKWQYDLAGGRTIRSSPSIGADGTIYVGAKASTTGSGAKGELFALNPNGSLKWEYPVGNGSDDVYCSPTVGADGLIYFGAETSQLYAMNPDGTLAWQYNTNNGINWTAPAIAPDGTLYIGNNAGTLFAINTSSSGVASTVWPKFRGDLLNNGVFTPPPQLAPPAPGNPSRPPLPPRP